MYGYKCEYCDGTVREVFVDREAFKHARGFVILEHVPVGICDTCGHRYYHASLLRRVEEIATGRKLLVPLSGSPSAVITLRAHCHPERSEGSAASCTAGGQTT